MSFIKKNWDILGGLITGLIITVASGFNLTVIQITYSIFILLLVSIGLFRVIKQSIDKQKETRKKERQHNIIDDMVDSQTPVRAISLAQKPTREGERLGHLLIDILKRGKRIMKNIKTFLDKFKGYILAVALMALSIIEMCGGHLNAAFGNVLVVNGVEVLPIVTLVLSVIVGCISNGMTKEQAEKVKALFTKKPSDELLMAGMKESLKQREADLKQKTKSLTTQELELDNLESQLVAATNMVEAKSKMSKMTPRLATDEEVQQAENTRVKLQAEVNEKKKEIETTKTLIEALNTTIGALKTQIKEGVYVK